MVRSGHGQEQISAIPQFSGQNIIMLPAQIVIFVFDPISSLPNAKSLLLTITIKPKLLTHLVLVTLRRPCKPLILQ